MKQLMYAPPARLLWLSVFIAASGCGSDGPQTIPVSGKVTFDGGPPPAAGTVYFLPVEAAAGFPSHPATGDFGTDGDYRAKTFEPNDGLMPGKYVMHIECWATPPNMEGHAVKSHVPKKYQAGETSGWKLDLKPDMSAHEMNFDIVTK